VAKLRHHKGMGEAIVPSFIDRGTPVYARAPCSNPRGRRSLTKCQANLADDHPTSCGCDENIAERGHNLGRCRAGHIIKP
jgi:hypothetical protein